MKLIFLKGEKNKMITTLVSTGIGIAAGLGAEKVTALIFTKVLTQPEAQKLMVQVGTLGITMAVGAITAREVRGITGDMMDSVKMGIDRIRTSIQKEKGSKK